VPQYQVLYWRHIPAQVRVFDGRRPLSKQLPPKYQALIDKVAMDEGLAGTDDYLAQWQWTDRQERDGDPAALLDEIVAEIISEYERDR
jgi:hypothetical protein